MDSGRWQQIKSVFDEAYDKPREERAAFLNEACAGDAGLLKEIKALFAAEDSVHSMLDGVAMDAAEVLDDVSREGQRIGPYVLKEQLGVGGMGEVFLAERADGQFEHQVALKLIRAGAQSEHILARFRSERQILARLQHPNIARLLDGGVSEEGHPYFVLEFVAGQPIDTYANENGLGLEERLKLFEQVCQAVTYAHQNLVVHRDLKPSNILVKDDGTVKLLDFGIAKVLTEADDSVPITRTGAAVMTPAYASPEQAKGEPVNTSTDIYSLGVVLYELLTGLRPYDVDANNPLEAARVICEVEPERPSTAVTDTSDATSSTHGSDTGRLRRLLAGDLDVICLKALRKEPERRYKTADELEDDIRRHRQGQPIEARADSVGYRAGKFVRRHRVGIGFLSLTVVAIATLVIVYTNQLAAARDEAIVARDEAEGVTEFMSDVLEAARPEAAGPSVLLMDALDLAADSAMVTNAESPVLQARIQHEIGYTFYQVGQNGKAVPLLRAAVLTREQELGMKHLDTRQSRDYLLRAILGWDRTQGADSLLAVMLENQPDGPKDEVALAAQFWESIFVRASGDLERSIELQRQLIEDYTESVGYDAKPTLQARHVLGDRLSQMGQHEEALEIHKGVAEARERTGVPDYETLNSKAAVARELKLVGRLDEAIEHYETLLTEVDHVVGPQGETALVLRGNLSNAYLEVEPERLEEATALRKEVFEARVATNGPAHHRTLDAQVKYAYVLARNDLDAARYQFDQAVGSAGESWSGMPSEHARLYDHFAESLEYRELWDDALALRLKAWEIRSEAPSPIPSRWSAAASRTADVYEALGNEEEAERWRAAAQKWEEASAQNDD